MNRTAFLGALRFQILSIYGASWALDSAKVERFIGRTRETIEGSANLVNIDGPAFKNAWQSIGGKGKPTFKGLRALPEA